MTIYIFIVSHLINKRNIYIYIYFYLTRILIFLSLWKINNNNDKKNNRFQTKNWLKNSLLLTQYTFSFPSSSPFILFFSCFHCHCQIHHINPCSTRKKKKNSTFKKLSTSFSIRSTNYKPNQIFFPLSKAFTILKKKTPLLFRKYPKTFERSRNVATAVDQALEIRRRYEIAVGKS